MGPGVFFDLKEEMTVNSTVYQDQILIGPLEEFWKESFRDIEESIVIEDNAPIYKKVCILSKKSLEWDVINTYAIPLILTLLKYIDIHKESDCKGV